MSDVQRCRFANTDENGAHDFTDAYSPDGRPEFLYCRRCGEVIMREPTMVVAPSVEPLPPANPSLMGPRS